MPFEMLWDVFFSQKVLFWEAYQPCPSHPSFLSTTLEKQNSQCYHPNFRDTSWLMRVLITWLIVIQSYHRGSVFPDIYTYISLCFTQPCKGPSFLVRFKQFFEMFPNSSEKYARQIGIMSPNFAGKKRQKTEVSNGSFRFNPETDSLVTSPGCAWA